jgi:hypothetical protein
MRRIGRGGRAEVCEGESLILKPWVKGIPLLAQHIGGADDQSASVARKGFILNGIEFVKIELQASLSVPSQ